ncbi:MAG TPA: LysM peptidoglycan-binding domain-containing protein [Methanothrix soehngenii]|nr:LysM peptidoglycan-binding domain-containing protein [Methanothrix soehngenii]
MDKSPKSSELKKAVIHVLDLQGNMTSEVPVLFYPSEYSMEKSNEFAKITIPGLESPLLQFSSGGLETLNMDLFFDTYEMGEDVRKYTNKIADLLKVDPDIHAPPVLRFVWGNLNFTCVLTRLAKKFTMFTSDGIPVRATLSATFSEYRTEGRSKERPLQSPDKTKIRTVREGDFLWAIAAEVYGDPALWRPIADENEIKNPRILEPGVEITIPPLD